MTLLLVFLIGLLTGLRSLTPVALTAWATHLGWLKVSDAFAWIGSAPAVGIFTLLALVELVADKLPSTPSRTAPVGLLARIVMSGLAGACVATAGVHGAAAGIVVGIIGALVGSFGGYQVRKRLVKALGTPDYVVAVLEDLLTIGGSLWVVTRFVA